MANFYRDDYHEEQPQWRRNYAEHGPAIGVELELWHEDGYQRMLDLMEEPGADEGERPLCEEDGSLSENYGMEIVFPPYKPDVIKHKGSYFARMLAKLQDAGTTPNRTCGLHLNVNTIGWKDRQRQCFAAVIHHLPTSWVKRIGKRGVGEYRMRYVFDTLTQYNGGLNYGMAEMHNNRIECRFPAGTVDHDDICVLTDFLMLLAQLCEKKQFMDTVEKILGSGGQQERRFRKVANYLGSELLAMGSAESLKVLEVLTDEDPEFSASEGASEAPATTV